MAHFAEIDENNIVTQVIVVHNNELLFEGEESETKGIDFCESIYGHRNWVQTSYNGNIRYNYAGVGFTWDPDNNAFYSPKPFPSWSLDGNFNWKAPVKRPDAIVISKTRKIGGIEVIYDEGEKYTWNEENQEWKVVELTIE